MDGKELNLLEQKLDKVRQVRLTNTEEKRNISNQILEEDIESDSRQILVHNFRLLETIDCLLGLLEGIGKFFIQNNRKHVLVKNAT
jgi:hypothetical protein